MKADKKRTRRRQASIHAYVGENGSGKSLAMIHDTLPSLEMRWSCDNAGHRHVHDPGCPFLDHGQGCTRDEPACTLSGPTEGLRTVLSTVRIVDPATGEDHPRYERLTRWAQLLNVEHADVLLDEVQGVASSRGHQSLPPAVLNLLLQLRRRDAVLRLSSPAYARADLVLREVCQAVTYCRGLMPERDPEGERLWGANRLFFWRTYDALAFDEFTANKREQIRADIKQWYSRTRNADQAQAFYDTLDQVDHIRDADESGTCLTCGGRKKRQVCTCEPAGRTAARQREDRTRISRAKSDAA